MKVPSWLCETPFGTVNVRSENGVCITAPGAEASAWGLGWAHAKFRPETSLLARSLAWGRLSQVLPPRPETLEVDRFVRLWNFSEGLEKDAAVLDAGERAWAHAYAQGFNAVWEASRKPARNRSFQDESKWTLEDSLLLARVLFFFSWWETQGKLFFFHLKLIRAGVDVQRRRELFGEDTGTDNDALAAQINLPDELSPEAQRLLGLFPRLRSAVAVGLAGSRTVDGRPLLSIGFETETLRRSGPFLPVRLDTPDDQIFALTWPGIPCGLAGNRQETAWAVLPSSRPQVDFFAVEVKNRRPVLNGASGLKTRENDILLGNKALHHETYVEAQGTTFLTTPRADGWYLTSRRRGGEAPGSLKFLLSLTMTSKKATFERLKTVSPSWSATILVAGADGELESWDCAAPRVEAANLFSLPLLSEGYFRKPSPNASVVSISYPGHGAADQIFQEASRLRQADAKDLTSLWTDRSGLDVHRLVPVLRFAFPETQAGAVQRAWNGQHDGSIPSRRLTWLRNRLWERFWEPLAGKAGWVGDGIKLDSSIEFLLGERVEEIWASSRSAWRDPSNKNALFLSLVRDAFSSKVSPPLPTYPRIVERTPLIENRQNRRPLETPLYHGPRELTRAHVEHLGGRECGFSMSSGLTASPAAPPLLLFDSHLEEIDESEPNERDFHLW